MVHSRGIRERHGMKKTPVYAVWCSMKRRCFDKNCVAYPNYGGRGITVCKKWLKFSGFFEDMGHPGEGMSLERIDNNKGYSLDNCVWADNGTQSRNKRNNIKIEINGETRILADWAAEYGLKYTTVHARIKKGWPPEKAVTFPLVMTRKGIPSKQRNFVWQAERQAEGRA